MKIKIQKLGSIQNAEFDLRPLTVLVGPNNTGKTWLAYALSAIFGSYGLHSYIQAYVKKQQVESYPPLEKAIDDVLNQGNATIDLYSFAENYGENYFNNIANFSYQWMSDFMSTQYSHFDTINLSIQLDEMKEKFLKHIKDSSFRRNISHGLLSINKKSGEDIIYIYTSSETENNEQITTRLPDEEIRELLVDRVMHSIHQALYPHIRVFPTERTTIVTFNFRNTSPRFSTFSALPQEKIQELIKMLDSIATEFLDPSQEQNTNAKIIQRGKAVVGPVGSFISMLSDLLEIGSKELKNRRKSAENNRNIQAYCDLADVLETKILAGKVAFSTTEPDPRRDILFQPAQNVHIEMPLASSMVKELSSLVLYLRYLARPGELVIIDEPEMNLHPLAQVQIIEFLAALVNAGLHILITTHSTYVVDHLGNLLEAARHENKNEIVEKFLLEREDAFIDQSMVSVYELTQDGEIENVLDDDGTIHWQTFSDVTELVQRIHFEL